MNHDSIITSKTQLVKWFEEGNKKKENWKVGTEHEKFAYNYDKEKNSFIPAEYDSKSGIENFLLEISKGFPKKHEVFTYHNYVFTIEAFENKRIKQIKLSILPKA